MFSPVLHLFDTKNSGDWLQTLSVYLCRLRHDHRLAQGDTLSSAPPPAAIHHHVRQGVLYIEVFGPLDLRCTFRMLAIARSADEHVAACRLGLLGVTSVFDSGIAALMLLVKVLAGRSVSWIWVSGLGLGFARTDPG
ncbi:MAG: hypothetical protein GVY22_12325 [Gammaproteobacteria bacterium]|jgi:uncharacterized membrane protein YecN with MAPEG domain|nr:hypothetical protein [Gammaproteobacteria bacterium]